MLNAIVVVMRFVILLFGGQRHVALENVALRQQLAAFKRDHKHPRLNYRDRLFLDWVEGDLEELEIRSDHRATRNGHLILGAHRLRFDAKAT